MATEPSKDGGSSTLSVSLPADLRNRRLHRVSTRVGLFSDEVERLMPVLTASLRDEVHARAAEAGALMATGLGGNYYFTYEAECWMPEPTSDSADADAEPN